MSLPFRGNEVIVRLPPGRNKQYKAALSIMLDKDFATAEKKLSTLVQSEKSPPPEAWLALAVCREALGPEHFAAAREAYTEGYANTTFSERIKDECKAGKKRIEARERFARKTP